MKFNIKVVLHVLSVKPGWLIPRSDHETVYCQYNCCMSCHINGIVLYLCSSGGAGSSGNREVRSLKRPLGADRDHDSPQETERARNSPGQFHGDNAVMGPVVTVQQQRQRPRKLIVSILYWCVACNIRKEVGSSYKLLYHCTLPLSFKST